ncbi:MAG: hypothetical protein LBV70_04330 [Candidatus Adiutrix sp.]|jgi:hypothetical protein|nr:hypothetical protein [Candidatus Adiutrix sp.]
MKNHILKEHASDGDEDCLLLLMEGAHAKAYWLLADIAQNKSLASLDAFLRKIWLECCGHLSLFSLGHGQEVGKARKVGVFPVGAKFRHEYDMGTTTECLITVVGSTSRPKQKNAVRLLARNVPPAWKCASCGRPAELVCQECQYDVDNPNFCPECAEKHEHEMFLPITNSPRNGECGYEGELDTFAFQPGGV